MFNLVYLWGDDHKMIFSATIFVHLFKKRKEILSNSVQEGAFAVTLKIFLEGKNIFKKHLEQI
jgi:hypothetical protein